MSSEPRGGSLMPDFVNVWGHMYIGDGSPNHNTSLAFLLQLPPYYRNTKYIYIFYHN